MAIKKDFKFNGRNLTLDLGKMSRLSSSEKLSMLSDRSTRAMLSSLTAQQFASTFPEYYKRQLPDVGANLPGVRSLAPLSKEAAQNMQQDTARQYRENERIKTSRREMATPVPSWMRKVQAESGVNVSDPKAVAQLSDERKKLLKDMEQGKIAPDDSRVSFLKDLSDEDLQKAGIKREKNASGEVSAYSRDETASSKLSDDAIADKLRNSAAGGFSPRERATLDFIAKREGSKNADIIFGDKGNVPGTGKYSKELGLDKRPLSDHSISEVLDLQPKLTRITREDGVGGGRGTSAVGTGQMIRGTLLGNLRSLGIPESDWPKLKFDKTLQERLTLQNFKTSGIGDPNADPSTWNQARLGAQYESIDTRKGFRAMSQTEMQSIAGASPTKVIGPITSESITVERKRLEEQERQQQETFLAGRTVPVLPDGADPKFASEFAKMSPGQKQRNVEAITKIGAARFNELYRSTGSADFLGTRIRDGTTSNDDIRSRTIGGYKNKIYDPANLVRLDNKNATRNMGITSDLQSKIGSAIQKVYGPGYYAKVYSGGQSGIGSGGPRVGSTRHDHGKAADTYIYGPDGRVTGDGLAPLAKYWIAKNMGGVGLEMRGGGIHLDEHQKPGNNFWTYGSITPAQRAAVEEGMIERERLLTAQRLEQSEQAKQTAPAANTTVQATQTVQATAPAANTIPTIQAFAEGGKAQVNADEIRAMPIKNTKNDNSVVVDKKDNPIFTMNTKEETANFDPLTRQVSVSPINRDSPEDLMSQNAISNDTTTNNNNTDTDNNNNRNRFFDAGAQNYKIDAPQMTNMQSEFMNDPSYRRAIAKTRFVDSGDQAMGGHFGSANSDLS